MFVGEHICKLDEKGRFVLPSLTRDVLEEEGKRVVFLKGPEESLAAYSMAGWRRILEQSQQALNEEESRLFMHHVLSEMMTSDVDKGGRLLIPGKMRKHLQLDLEQEVVVVGLYKKFEIWNPGSWRRYLATNEEKFEMSQTRIMAFL